VEALTVTHADLWAVIVLLAGAALESWRRTQKRIRELEDQVLTLRWRTRHLADDNPSDGTPTDPAA
jgi:hypothetical protein